MNIGKIDYSTRIAPKDYKCSVCGKHACKLWRQYQTFADQIELMCCDCAGKDQGKDVSDIDENGKVSSDIVGRCDQIGWMVPAVPTEDGTTYWGYSSVPQDGVLWWLRLPIRV